LEPGRPAAVPKGSCGRPRNDSGLQLRDSNDWRPLVLLLVLISHGAAVVLALRATRSTLFNLTQSSDALWLLTPQTATATPPRPASAPVDWQHEVEFAAQNFMTNQQTQGNYRDLSALTAQQQNWLKQNLLEPAPPGITWQHPRVEVQNGLPILRINDHRVMIPPLLLMVFCSIGHSEANGNLFEHMRDPHEP
jgi:hypothetical protein